MASPELLLPEVATDPSEHAPVEGAVRFVAPEERVDAHVELALAGALVVPVPTPRRGHVGETVEEALEGELVARGAVGSAVFAHAYPEDVLSDQLFRARRLGFHGVCVSLPSLASAAVPYGLDPIDASYLAELSSATRDRPVVLLLDASDEDRGAFATTVPLSVLLRRRDVASPVSEPPVSTERLAVAREDETPEQGCAEAVAEADADAVAEAVADADAEADAEAEARLRAAGSRSETAGAGGAILSPSRAEGAQTTEYGPAVAVAEADADAVADADAFADAGPDAASPLPPDVEPNTPELLDVPRVVVDTVLETAARDETPEPPSSAPPVVSEIPWRDWVSALRAARGPQPLAAFERLFLQSYLPLATAVDAGLRAPEAVAMRDEFRRIFARAYAEACPAFPLTHKRPRMVLDAHDVASRTARLHQARSTQLVLVDGMRFDAGLRVRDLVTDELAGHATLVGQVVLFASLPTVTSRQLEGLARGVDSLRLAHDMERDSETLRARTAEVLRRVKVGSRDVHKLDVIEARVRPSLDVLSELDGAADAAADAIVKHARGLSGRTLLFAFGDHGFVVDKGRATFGGASPEEVIVPGFAWLVGELH